MVGGLDIHKKMVVDVWAYLRSLISRSSSTLAFFSTSEDLLKTSGKRSLCNSMEVFSLSVKPLLFLSNHKPHEANFEELLNYDPLNNQVVAL